MAAIASSRVGEDGIIEPFIETSRMSPEEYEARRKQAKERTIRALETLAPHLSDACYSCTTVKGSATCYEKQAEHSCEWLTPGVTRVHEQPKASCDICGGQASWKAISWMRSYEVTLCNDHMQSRIDQYKSFDRIS